MLLHTLLKLVEHLDQLPHDRAVIPSLHGAPDQRRIEPKRRPELHEMVRKSTERGDMFVLLERGQGIGQVPTEVLSGLSNTRCPGWRDTTWSVRSTGARRPGSAGAPTPSGRRTARLLTHRNTPFRTRIQLADDGMRALLQGRCPFRPGRAPQG
jgi:hypothetical protein